MSSKGNTSIEMVSEDGPIDFNIMMKEGVKALTKILTEHLQDNPEFLKQQCMKLVFKDQDGKLQPVLSTESPSPTNDHENEEGDVEEIELDNHSNYHVYPQKGTQESHVKSIELNIGEDFDGYGHEDHIVENETNSDREEFYEENEVEDPDLHLASSEGEILFDYGPENLSEMQSALGERISKVFESTFNGNKLGNEEKKYEETVVQKHKNGSSNSSLQIENESTKSGKKCSNKLLPTHIHDNRCQQENHHNYDYHHHNYEYNPKIKPDFASLAVYGQPLCLFCEYYLVFGAAPTNMIKWYNKTSGHGPLPPPPPPKSSKHHGRHNKH